MFGKAWGTKPENIQAWGTGPEHIQAWGMGPENIQAKSCTLQQHMLPAVT